MSAAGVVAVGVPTLPEAARIMRDAIRDKSYRAYPIGGEAGHYLRWKRRRLTPASYRDYESCLDKLARYFCGLELSDLEPPAGTEELERFLDHQWGDREARTLNKNLSILKDFFGWAVLKGKLYGDPIRYIEPAKGREPVREVFAEDIARAIIDDQDSPRDRVACRLLLLFGIRKGSLQALQFKHFDHASLRVSLKLKGGKRRRKPLPHPELWRDLEQHILEWGARPGDYLLPRRKAIPHGHGEHKRMDVVEYRDQPMGAHGLHNWWYGCLERAGIVPAGVTRGERMHKARHTAGQRVLDKTQGNLKAVQRFLDHEDIRTTGNVYVDWDIDALEKTLREVLGEED